MEQVAFINGGTFIYWSSIILTFAVIAAVFLFAGLYLWKSKNGMALSLTLPVALLLSVVIGRWIHWYCLTDSYDSLHAAMTDYTWGGYALTGAFFGCLLTACIMRLLQISKNLPEMLDCMSIAGGVGIAVGRLASMFNASDRGQIVADKWELPFAYPVPTRSPVWRKIVWRPLCSSLFPPLPSWCCWHCVCCFACFSERSFVTAM